MRLSLPSLLIPVLVAFTAASACAAPGGLDHNRYKWRDAAGNLHYSDTLPADALSSGYEVVSPRGLVVKRVDRAKTKAEQVEAKAQAARIAAEQEEIAARARADAQLLAGYPEEVDLVRAQRQKLELLKQQVVAAQISLRSQEQILADLLGRAAEVERAEQALPDAQARQVADTRKQVDNQRLKVVRRESELNDAQGDFEREIAHYRELKTQIADRRQAQ